MELPNRKKNRLDGFDYSNGGCYFITICVKCRKHILSNITVGTPVPTMHSQNTDNSNSTIILM